MTLPGRPYDMSSTPQEPIPEQKPEPKTDQAGEPLQPGDFYMEGPYLVFTAQYHLRRGFCCNSGCRHCPYS